MSQLTLTVLLALIILTGSTIQSSIGFGNAVFAMSFLPYLLPYNKAVGIAQIFSTFLNVFMLTKYWRYIDWKTCLPQLSATLVASFFITSFALSMDASILYLALGFLFILLSLYFTLFMDRIHLKASVGVSIADGLAAGVINGFFGVGGPVSVLYFASVLHDKKAYLGTIQFCFFLSNILSIAQRLAGGVFVRSDLTLIAAGAAAVFAGNYIGGRLVEKINGKLLKKLIYLFIGVNGLTIVLPRLFA